MRTYLTIGLLCIAVLTGLAQSPPQPVITDHTGELQVLSDAAIVIDSTNRISINELRRNIRLFKPIQRNVNFGRNQATNWLRFTIRNKHNRPSRYFVYIYYPRLESIKAYALVPPQRLLTYPETGWGIPLARRPFPHPKNVLPITLAAHQEATFFLAVRSHYQRIIVPISLHRHEQMILRMQVATLTDGIVSCILLFVFTISIAYFFDSSFSEWGNFWYGLYALCAFLFYLIRFDLQYVNQEPLDPLLNQYVDIFTTLILVFYCLSGYCFMSDVVISNWFIRWYATAMAGLSVVGILLLTIHTATSLELAVLTRATLSVVSSSGLLYVLVKGLLGRARYARLFFWMFIPLLLGYVVLTYATDLSNGTVNVDTDLTMKGIVCLETTLMMIGFIYKNSRIKHQLKHQLAEQKTRLLITQIQTQEAEQQRIAADLHDDLGGTLATLHLRLADLTEQQTDPQVRTQLAALEPILRQSSHDLRRIAHNLMPPAFAQMGLRAALEQLVRSQSPQPTRFTFLTAGTPRPLPLEVELNAYRIVSELVQNIHKHARATRADIQLLYHDTYLSLVIEDNGIGEQVIKSARQSVGIGLATSSLRAEYIGATLRRDVSGGGTLVVLDVPYLSMRSTDDHANSYPPATG